MLIKMKYKMIICKSEDEKLEVTMIELAEEDPDE